MNWHISWQMGHDRKTRCNQLNSMHFIQGSDNGTIRYKIWTYLADTCGFFSFIGLSKII